MDITLLNRLLKMTGQSLEVRPMAYMSRAINFCKEFYCYFSTYIRFDFNLKSCISNSTCILRSYIIWISHITLQIIRRYRNSESDSTENLYITREKVYRVSHSGKYRKICNLPFCVLVVLIPTNLFAKFAIRISCIV